MFFSALLLNQLAASLLLVTENCFGDTQVTQKTHLTNSEKQFRNLCAMHCAGNQAGQVTAPRFCRVDPHAPGIHPLA